MRSAEVRLWIRARRAWWLVAALVVMLGLDGLVGGLSMSVPALFGGGAGVVFLRTYLPLVWAAAIADAFAGRGLSIEARPMPLGELPPSRLGLHDACLFVVASSVTAALFSGLSSSGFLGAGPVLVLSGVTCIWTLRAGPAVGVFVSTMLVLLTSTYPRTAPGSRFVHVLQPDGEPAWSLALGIVLSLMAAGLLATTSVRTRLRASEAGAL
jgi:hypothetical protein